MADSTRQERAQWRAVKLVPGEEGFHILVGEFTDEHPIAAPEEPNGIVAYVENEQYAKLIVKAVNAEQEERIFAEKIVAKLRVRAEALKAERGSGLPLTIAIEQELNQQASELERTYCPEPEAEVIRCDAYACPICGVHAKPCSHFGIDYGLTPSRGVYFCNECGESDTPCKHYRPEPDKETTEHE